LVTGACGCCVLYPVLSFDLDLGGCLTLGIAGFENIARGEDGLCLMVITILMTKYTDVRSYPETGPSSHVHEVTMHLSMLGSIILVTQME
jgi:hypothetical protein